MRIHRHMLASNYKNLELVNTLCKTDYHIDNILLVDNLPENFTP